MSLLVVCICGSGVYVLVWEIVRDGYDSTLISSMFNERVKYYVDML